MNRQIISYTMSIYDMFHIGYLNVIQRAKAHCDYLIVGVSSDDLVLKEKGKTPVIPYEERARIVAALRDVNQMVIQPDKNELITWENYHFNKMFIESDWEDAAQWQSFEEQFAPLEIEIVYCPHTLMNIPMHWGVLDNG